MALGILSKLYKPESPYMLVMFSKLLGITEGLRWYLSGVRFGLGQSSSVQDSNPSNFDRASHRLWWWMCSRGPWAQACEANDFQLPVAPRQNQKRFDGFRVESACGSTPRMTSDISFWYLCMDRMVFKSLCQAFKPAAQLQKPFSLKKPSKVLVLIIGFSCRRTPGEGEEGMLFWK